jgi:Zn-dependent protease with chaperone function
MNDWLTLSTWLQLLGLLAVEMALVVGAAALISRIVASTAWRRTVWQVCFLGLLALTLSELTGTARSVTGWLAVKVSSTKRLAAKSIAANRSDASPASGQLSEPFHTNAATPPTWGNQRKRVETGEATPVVVHLLGTDLKPTPATMSGLPNQKSVDRADTDGDSLAESLAILGFELIWLAGAGLVIARGCVARVLFALFRRQRQALSDSELRRRVESLARLLGIKRRVFLVESSRLAVPIVFGVLRPVVGLPTGFARRYTPVQQEAILAHELTHLAARDPAWYLLADWASAILWWHPMVWWARRRLHAASEMAADEASLVVGDGPVVLAECLAEMGARLAQLRSSAWMGVVGNGLRSSLGQRVERLLHLRGTTYAVQDRLRGTLAKTLGPAALVTTAILATAWVGPQAFTQGESMNTMKQIWSRSLAALALLASVNADDQQVLSENRAANSAPSTDGSFAANQKESSHITQERAVPVEFDVQTLVGQGKQLLERGKFKEAEGKFLEVVRHQPNSKLAYYYLTLTAEALARSPDKKVTSAETEPAPAAEKPTQPDSAARAPEAPVPQKDLYYRLMMQRYGIKPESVSSATAEPRRKPAPDAIASKLEKIVLDEAMFDGLPLPEVLKFLNGESRKHDPDKHGLNFLINPNRTPVAANTVVDPHTGQAPEPVDMNSVIVKFNLPLRDVYLKDVLDAIVKVADKPIQYSVEEYGVVFSQSPTPLAGSSRALASKDLEPAPLQVRTFKVDAAKLLPGMKRAFGIDIERRIKIPPLNSAFLLTNENKYVYGQRARIEALKAELDSLKRTETNLLAKCTGASTLEPETLRRLEGARIEIESAYKGVAEHLGKLKELATQGPTALRKAILTAFNDELLSHLMQQLSTTEATLASKSTVYGPESPEIKQLAAMQVDLNNKVNDRIAGMLSGLEVNAAAKKAQLDSLAQAVDAAKTNDVDRAALYRPYLKKIREQIDELDKKKTQLELEQEYPQLAQSNAGDAQQIQVALRQLLIQLGIDLDAPGKLLIYNDLTSIVMVRATYQDLEVVKAVIDTLGGSDIGQAASSASAQDGATQSMMRRYGVVPERK